MLYLQNSDIVDLTTMHENILTIIPFIGEIFGSFLLPTFSDKYGRKKGILISALCLSFFGTLAALSWDWYLLLLCRFFIGCAVGGSSTCLSLVTEVIPQSHRGEVTYINISFWSIGVVCVVALGMFTSKNNL